MGTGAGEERDVILRAAQGGLELHQYAHWEGFGHWRLECPQKQRGLEGTELPLHQEGRGPGVEIPAEPLVPAELGKQKTALLIDTGATYSV